MRIVILILLLTAVSGAQTIEHSPFSDSVGVSLAEKSTIDSAFGFIGDELGFIDYNDCNNCTSRAHLISAILEKQFPSLKLAKVWLFADFKRASKEEIYRLKKNSYLTSSDECDSWGYHVAPCAIVVNGDRIDTVVLDPSTQKKPVSLGKWVTGLIPRGEKGLLVIKDKKYYLFPDNVSKKFEDLKPQWADDDKSLYDEDYSKSIEKILMSKRMIREHWVFSSDVKKIQDLLYGDED